MKKSESLEGGKCGHPARSRLLTDSVSSDDCPEGEKLLRNEDHVQVMVKGRRQSLTAPPSPCDSRKKHRHHNYMNHLHHLINWRDIWGGEPHKGHEVYK